MNTIGYMGYRYFGRRPSRKQWLVNPAADFTVLAADAVHGASTAYREPGHIEGFICVAARAAPERQQIVYAQSQFLGVVDKVKANQFRRKAIEGGADRCVRGEQVTDAGSAARGFEVATVPLHVQAGAFEHGESGMSLVQVADRIVCLELIQQTPATDSEHHFLLQSHLFAATVELGGDTAVAGVIAGIVTVEQQQRAATHLRQPTA